MNPELFTDELTHEFDGERIAVNVVDRRVPLIGTISAIKLDSRNFLYLNTVEFGMVLIPIGQITDVSLARP